MYYLCHAYRRFLHLLAVLVLSVVIVSACERGVSLPLDGGEFGCSVFYMGERTDALVYGVVLDRGAAGTYDMTLTDVSDGGDNTEVHRSSVLFDGAGQTRFLIFDRSLMTGGSLLLTVGRGEAAQSVILPDGRASAGTPSALFVETDLNIRVSDRLVLRPCFYPSIDAVISGGVPEWYCLSDAVVMDVRDNGMEVVLKGIREGLSRVGVVLGNGRETSLDVSVTRDGGVSFALSSERTAVFEGMAFPVRLSPVWDEPQEGYAVRFAVDGVGCGDEIDASSALEVDLGQYLAAGTRRVTATVMHYGMPVQSLALEVQVIPAPRPVFTCAEGRAVESGIFVCMGTESGLSVDPGVYAYDSWDIDFGGCRCVDSRRTAGTVYLRGVSAGEGRARLTVRKGEAVWTGEVTVICYGVVRMRPVFVYSGISTSNVRGGLKVFDHAAGAVTALSLGSTNHYRVTWGGSSSMEMDGTPKSFRNLSLSSGEEHRWELRDEMETLKRYLQGAGASVASLRSVVVRQSVTVTLDSPWVAVMTSDYLDPNMNVVVVLYADVQGLDPRVSDFVWGH